MFVFVSLDHLGLNVNNNNSLYVSSLNVCSCFSKVMQDQAENFNKTHIVGEDKSKCRHSLHYYSTPWTKKRPHLLNFAVVFTNIDRFLKNLAHIIHMEFATHWLLTCPLHLHTVATLSWEKLIRAFGTILADLLRQNAVKSTSNLKDAIRPMRFFCRCILLRCCANTREWCSHPVIAVTLTSNS